MSDTARILLTTTKGRVMAGRTAGQPRPAETPVASRHLPSDLQLIWDRLKHHRGAATAITQERLAELCGMAPRALQRCLKELQEVHGLPLCASCRPPMGVFLPETAEEAEAYAAQLRSRALSLFRRIKALSASVARELSAEVQETLNLESEAYTRVASLCAHCGSPFDYTPGKEGTQMYCSSLCRYRASNQRRAS